MSATDAQVLELFELLNTATHQLLLLEDEAALVAAEWLKNASARLAVDKATATIMSVALDQLATANP